MTYRHRVATVFLFGFFLDLINMFIASIAFPAISRALAVSVSQLAWVSNAYILGLTVVVPFSAWLSERWGAKRLFLLSLGLFSLGALAAGLANSLSELILWRTLQGMGGGLLIPLGQALTWPLFQPHERAKLSAAVILLLVLKPAVQLLREKRWKEIGLYLGLGFGIALPWLIRGVLISGWLFYPFTFLDLFPVDWKIEKGYADCDSKEIQVFARLLYDVNLYATPFSGWAGKWFASLKGLEKLWVAASAACTGLGAVTIVGAGLRVRKAGLEERKNRARKKEIQKKDTQENRPEADGILPWDWILYAAVLITGYFFWQFSAPLVRYGYVYVLALPAAVLGYCYVQALGKSEKGRRYGYYVFGAGFVLFLAFKAVGLAGGMAASAGEPYYVRQQGYGSFDAVTYDVDGVTVYVPADGGQIGYDKFPSSPRIQNIELRGEGEHAGDIRYGFRENRKEEDAQ